MADGRICLNRNSRLTGPRKGEARGKISPTIVLSDNLEPSPNSRPQIFCICCSCILPDSGTVHAGSIMCLSRVAARQDMPLRPGAC